MDKQQNIAIAICLVLVIAIGAYQLTRDTGTPNENTIDTGTIPNTLTVTDCLNRTITIDEPIERIIFTGRGNALTLSVAYLFENAQERIYGLSESYVDATLFSMVDPAIADKVLAGIDDMSVEELAAQEPDVVVLKSYLKADVGDPLESLGVNVVYLDLEDLDSYLRDVETMGALMGEPEKAEEIKEYYQNTYAEVKARHIDDADEPSVMFLYYNTKGGTAAFMSPGADWLQTTIIAVAGGDPLSLQLEGTGWNTVNMEQIAEWNPEVVFIVTYNADPSGQDVENMLNSDILWQSINAVQNGCIYSVPDDCYGVATVGSWDTSGSRWILCLQWMEAKISGNDAGLMDAVEGFYMDMYELSASEIDALLDSIVGDI